MNREFRLFPESASTVAGDVDALYFYLIGISLVFGVGIFVTILLLAWRFRAKKHPRAQAIHGSTALEVVWTLIPLLISLTAFFWGARVFFRMARPPVEAMDVYVTGKQWMWKLQHPGGQREINDLHVPVDTPVRLTMISEDVIHSFFVPAFRMKRDVVPGRYSVGWFEATKTGVYDLLCAEYCGTKHSRMIGKVYVLEQDEYQQWLAGGKASETPEQAGERLFGKLRCDTCHHDRADARGPLLAGRWGTAGPLADGRMVELDESYLRRSLVDPRADVAAGWEPVMPTYDGQISEEQILQIASYLRSLAPEAEPASDGGAGGGAESAGGNGEQR